jgi:hypoxanthine-DNA glycosylase
VNALPAVVSTRTRLLILGSFPGEASLRAGQYYAHPRNQFWPILASLLGEDWTALDYARRLERMLDRGIGLWDVYASCERKGSLDADIRAAVPNDLTPLNVLAPSLCAVAHNGAESFRHADRSAVLGVPTYRLPSTSPAHASWSMERKRAAWGEVFQRAGIIE